MSRKTITRSKSTLHNPLLAASIDSLSDSRNVRVVLTPGAMESIQPFFAGACRIRSSHEMSAYVQGPYSESKIYTWTEQKVVADEVFVSGQCIYELRRRPSFESELPRTVSMSELKREEGAREVRPIQGACFMDIVLHKPVREDPQRVFFDINRLIDLPPPGYPLSSTPIEGLRNILVKRNPGSRNRQWATHQRILLLIESAEERHARRVLDNEMMAEWESDKKDEKPSGR